MGVFKIQPVKKTRKFNGKVYKLLKYVVMRRQAEDEVRHMRYAGKSARFVPQPGYGQGGWNIYIRAR